MSTRQQDQGRGLPARASDPTTADGRRLHRELHGEGRATVVLEAGLGATCDTWAAVIPQVAPHTRVLAYDRAGLGRSERAQDRRHLPDLVADLSAVTADVPGRLLLVGHSWGGPIIRAFAAAHPERVLALVLVDPTDEGCPAYSSPAMALQTRLVPPLLPLLARTGLLAASLRPMADGLPSEAAARLVAESATPSAARATAAEMRALPAGIAQLIADPPRLPDVPALWISGGRASMGERRLRRSLVAAHERSAAAHGQGRHLQAEHSGHLIPTTEPELIAHEIRDLLVRASA